MESWIQAVPAILLIAAMLVAFSYVLRQWPDSRENIRRELRSLTSAIDHALPGLLSGIGRITRDFRNELSRIFPIWSATTTENREAEFTDDRLPDRFPFWVFVLAVVVLAALTWLIAR